MSKYQLVIEVSHKFAESGARKNSVTVSEIAEKSDKRAPNDKVYKF